MPQFSNRRSVARLRAGSGPDLQLLGTVGVMCLHSDRSQGIPVAGHFPRWLTHAVQRNTPLGSAPRQAEAGRQQGHETVKAVSCAPSRLFCKVCCDICTSSWQPAAVAASERLPGCCRPLRPRPEGLCWGVPLWPSSSSSADVL